MFKKILVPLDTSQSAESVLSILRRMAKPEVTRLMLVSAIEPSKYAYAAGAGDPQIYQRLFDAAESSTMAYLAELQNRLQQEGYVVTAHIAHGDAALSITDTASDHNVDLIAMSTHGRTGLMRAILGSVADRVVRTAQQPVLLVRSLSTEVEDRPIRRILVPLDGSALAEQALEQAKRVVQSTGAALEVVHVLAPMASWELQLLYGADRSADSIAIERAEEARAYLDTICQRLRVSQVEASAELYSGEAAESILNATEMDRIDMIVMSTHGYGGYTRWVYGSVANKVLHRTTCPLLLTRGRQMEAVAQLSAEEEGVAPASA